MIANRIRRPWRNWSPQRLLSASTPFSVVTSSTSMARASMSNRSAQRLGTNFVPQYPLYLADGLLEMGALTFVSFLVSVDLVRKVGLPLKEFFIWGDDTEYSRRLARFTRIYQVGKSKTKHLKSGDASQSVFKEQDRRQNIAISLVLPEQTFYQPEIRWTSIHEYF